uniref:Uncharacterized protein n=1 Tax=Arundo donax TaxID=35708 RepID=A0A0A9DUQ8_ARUDO
MAVSRAFSLKRALWSSPPGLVVSTFLATAVTQFFTALFRFSSRWRRSTAWHSATMYVEDMSLRMSMASAVFLAETRPREFTSWLCCSALWTWLVTGLARN